MKTKMIDLRNKKVTVAGLGRFGGGIAVSRWLAQQGADILVTDKASAQTLADSIDQLAGLSIKFHLENQREEDFTKADLVVASPAIPPSSPLLQAAKAANVPVTTEIRLFVERCSATVIGVTGTKGKSTTTELLGRMLKTTGPVWVGGNIGKSLLNDLPKILPGHLVVLELSSFMLEHLGAAKWSPKIATVTMISSDHLDWHGSQEAYVNAKRNIVRFQPEDGIAVLNEENDLAVSFAKDTKAKLVRFGLKGRRPFELSIAGAHNQLNAQAAFFTAYLCGVTWEQAQAAIKDFTGLSHRLQFIHESNGIKFINDSIATIPEAAIAALNSFPQKTVIQIVGGSKKKDPPIEDLCAALASRAKAVLCIGETGPKIAAHVPGSIICETLANAVTKAKLMATSRDVVLLSPGYASYDQFINFEKRGEEFARLCKLTKP